MEKLNALHNQDMGIYEPSDMDDIYEIKETQSYLKVLCKISKKCAFSVWFKFQKNRFGDYIQIKCHRSISQKHELKWHTRLIRDHQNVDGGMV